MMEPTHSTYKKIDDENLGYGVFVGGWRRLNFVMRGIWSIKKVF